jgi:SAM-dependent methyltransferase
MKDRPLEIPGYLSLDIDAQEIAVRYQQWIVETIMPYLGKRILELGAGAGQMSRYFTSAERLVLVENDSRLINLLETRMKNFNSDKISIKKLNIERQSFEDFQQDNIDTIVSFNVLEHIENDLIVLQKSAELLRNSRAKGKKRIIHFVPAHMWAYGKMDKAVGHYRRYNKSMFKQLHNQSAPDATLILKPFNFFALFGWLINGRILGKTQAGTKMVGVFERFCPFFKIVDKLLHSKLNIPIGNSIIAVQEWS